MSDRASRAPYAPDEFRRARDLFESALDWPPGDRARLIRVACGEDTALVAVVEAMLQADAAPHALLDGSAALPADRWQPNDVFAGRYAIAALIGRGGMGEVYRAHDRTLGRDVALKVLPPVGVGVTAGDRLARFRREAQVLASLNHPNVAAIHGVEEADGVRALVLELVEGRTLAARLAEAPLPLAEVVAIARQIAVGLEAAHEQGIVHRDLKPANVMLRPDGPVKLLDFGLAKVVQPEAAALTDGAAAASPTVTSPSTIQGGVLLGTAAYMSPEQTKGHEADRRSDVWAFGALLYEMLTGVRAFAGQDIPETLAAVLRADVDWARLPTYSPPALRHLLARCLDRDRARRLRDIGEARIVLDDLAIGAPDRALPGAPSDARTTPWRRAIVPSLAAIAAGLAVAAALWPSAPAAAPPLLRFALIAPADRALRLDPQSRDLAITPDGTRVVYKGGGRADRSQLFVHALDALEPTPLTPPGQPKGPFTSPDGQWIGFFEPGPPGAALKKVSISGGPPIDVSRLDGASRGATWGESDVIIAASSTPATGLLRIPAGGGAFEVLTTPGRDRGEGDHLYPHFLPGGRSVLFTITSVSGGIDAAQVAVLDLETRMWRTVMSGASQAQYGPGGRLVYVAGGAIWSVGFDATRLQIVGTASVLAPQVVTLPTGAAEFDLARDGTLVYVAGGGTRTAPRTLVWVDRQGRETPIAAPPRPYAHARLSPDGTRVAVEVEDVENDIWVWHFERETLSRVTTDPGLDESPVWTRDGRRIVFTSETGGVMGSLFWQSADGFGRAEAIGDGTRIQRASAITADGARVLFSEGTGLLTMSLDGRRDVRTLLRLPQAGGDGAISPDGRWLAYVEIGGDAPQVFVSPFAAPDRDRVQVTPAGGTQPRWSASGRELFYVGLDGRLMSIEIRAGAPLAVGRPRRILDQAYFHGLTLSRSGTYDVAGDGERLLMIKDAASADQQAMVVVVKNWLPILRDSPPR